MIRELIKPYLAARWVMRRASVAHISFTGGPLGVTRFWKHEERLLRWSGVKTVVIPYGGDLYRYSRIGDPSLRHALLRDYPLAARRERSIQDRVDYWVERADVVMAGFDVDGLGRWDIPPHNMCAIDTVGRDGRSVESSADGSAGTVVVAHAPNHRGFKGTEFVIRAIDELQDEGIAVELMLLERVPNEEVQRRFREEAHILLDQLITVGYGFAAIEGMAAGLPVIANLDDDRLLRVFRTYSSFKECPLVSATPETVKDVLRELIRRPTLREELGRAGRQYVEQFHSYEAAARLFGAIHSNLLDGGTVDLMRVFEPETGVLPAMEPITHPLVRNRLVFDD
jgi:glycosyltransferase involved in cell wall biosynthesis